MPSPDDPCNTTRADLASEANDGRPPSRLDEDKEDLAAIDGAIARMRSLTPSDPYILTIPQEDKSKYRYTWQFQTVQWLDHTPFSPREHESIQYLTWVFHDPAKGMYLQHSTRPREVASDAKEAKAGNAPTPNTGPKKKISLSTYKKKLADGMLGGEDGARKDEKREEQASAKKAAVKGPAEQQKEDEDMLAATSPPPARQEPGSAELKRKRGENRSDLADERAEVGQPRPAGPAEIPSPAPKKARRSPTLEEEKRDTPSELPSDPAAIYPQSQQKNALAEEVPRSLGDPIDLDSNNGRDDLSSSLEYPDMPGPDPHAEDGDMPPRLSPLEMPFFPGRLTPTIPENIMSALKLRKEFNVQSTSNLTTAKDGKLTPAKRVDGITKTKSPVPRNGFRANSSSPAVRSDAESRSRLAPSVLSGKVRTRDPSVNASEGDEIVVAPSKKVNDARERRPSLIVTLKVPSQRRHAPTHAEDKSAVKSIHKSKSENPSKEAFVKHDRKRSDAKVKGVAQRVGPAPAPAKSAEIKDARITSPRKRAYLEESDDDADPPAKRKDKRRERSDSVKKEPSTPGQAHTPSPAAATHQKQLTPSIRKDVLSAAMKRDLSTEGTSTPLGPSDSPNAGGVGNARAKANSTVSKPSSTKTPLQEAWGAEQKRLEALGRELKHAATDHLKNHDLSTSSASKEPPRPTLDQKLAAVKSLESLLAYILAFSCADEMATCARPVSSTTSDPTPPATPSLKLWRSLHGYYKFVEHNTAAIPALHGLACALGIVFNARILELSASACSAGVPSSSASASDQHPQTQAAQADFLTRSTVLATFTDLQRAAADAEARGALDIDHLQTLFPRTCAARTRGEIPREKSIINLPASSSSSSAAAAAGPSEQDVRSVKKGKYAGPYQLPFGVQTPPVRAVRAGVEMLGEWVERQLGRKGKAGGTEEKDGSAAAGGYVLRLKL